MSRTVADLLVGVLERLKRAFPEFARSASYSRTTPTMPLSSSLGSCGCSRRMPAPACRVHRIHK